MGGAGAPGKASSAPRPSPYPGTQVRLAKPAFLRDTASSQGPGHREAPSNAEPKAEWIHTHPCLARQSRGRRLSSVLRSVMGTVVSSG